MRDYISLVLNGEPAQVRGRDCFLSLSDYLRGKCGLTGTKIVCSEGDCGSCTVLVGRPNGETVRYQPIDSCIQYMFQLDGTHVVTVEGLGLDRALTPVQDAMVTCHGSQCGFCTPGFVVAMTGLLEERPKLAEDDLRHGLTGNLCRCTGYTPIIQAGLDLDAGQVQRINEIYPSQNIVKSVNENSGDFIAVHAKSTFSDRRLFSPTSIKEAVEVLGAHPNAKIVAGATDVGVQLNKRTIEPRAFIDSNRVADLEGARIENGELVAGARATWTEIVELCRGEIPEFYNIVSVFGSPQIRHVGTIGGNIINASPIADSLPFLFVMEAELELASAQETRRVNITNFYHGYKELELKSSELLTQIRVPLPEENERLRLYKVSRRRDLDISTFTGAILMELDGDAISNARVAFGAVGPTVMRATRTEEFLTGRQFTAATMVGAGDVAVAEISPISDVRGSDDYRFQLTRNVLLKFYHQEQASALATV